MTECTQILIEAAAFEIPRVVEIQTSRNLFDRPSSKRTLTKSPPQRKTHDGSS